MHQRDNPTWQTAWAWVTRQHEQALDSDAKAALMDWLCADPTHREAYDQATHLWLLSGLVPPVNTLPTQDDDQDPAA